MTFYVCLSETLSDDVDINMIKSDRNTLSFDIIYKNRQVMSTYKSGGLLTAIKKTCVLPWKALPCTSDVFISVQVG